MRVEKLLDTQITILFLILVGYLLTKVGVMGPDFRKALTDFLIAFILPCNIIHSFCMPFDEKIMGDSLTVFLISLATQLVTWLLGKGIFAKAPPERKPALQYGTMVSNAGFLGNPIVEGLYGELGLLYASVYLIPQRIMMWSAGVACFTGQRGRGVAKKIVTHPCIVAVAIGLVLMVTQLPLPGWLEKGLGQVSGCNTALSLLVIGGILGQANPRGLFCWQTMGYCAVRLLLIPALVWLGGALAGLDAVVLQTATVLAGMPAPLTLAILASQYEKDAQFAVSLVFFSTVFSMVTIPGLCALMTLLG